MKAFLEPCGRRRLPHEAMPSPPRASPKFRVRYLSYSVGSPRVGVLGRGSPPPAPSERWSPPPAAGLDQALAPQAAKSHCRDRFVCLPSPAGVRIAKTGAGQPFAKLESTGRLGDGWVSKEWENGELKKENQSLRSELARLRKEAQREVQVRIEKIKDLNWTIAKKQEQAKQSERRLAEAKQANASLNRRISKLNNPQTSPAPPTKARGTKVSK